MRSRHVLAIAGTVCVAALLAAVPSPAPGQEAGELSFPITDGQAAIVEWAVAHVGLSPSQVVAVTDTVVVSVAGDGLPRRDAALRRIKVRADSISRDAYQRTGIGVWIAPAEARCPDRKIRMGATVGYEGREVVGEGLPLRPADAEWKTPPAGTVLDGLWRAACSREGVIDAPPAVAARVATPPATPRALRSPPPRAVQIAATADLAEMQLRGPLRTSMLRPTVGRFELQLAAVGSPAAAEQLLTTVRARFPVPLRGRGTEVRTGQANGRPVYRAFIVGFADRPDALRSCRLLQAQDQDCFVRLAP